MAVEPLSALAATHVLHLITRTTESAAASNSAVAEGLGIIALGGLAASAAVLVLALVLLGCGFWRGWCCFKGRGVYRERKRRKLIADFALEPQRPADPQYPTNRPTNHDSYHQANTTNYLPSQHPSVSYPQAGPYDYPVQAPSTTYPTPSSPRPYDHQNPYSSTYHPFKSSQTPPTGSQHPPTSPGVGAQPAHIFPPQHVGHSDPQHTGILSSDMSTYSGEIAGIQPQFPIRPHESPYSQPPHSSSAQQSLLSPSSATYPAPAKPEHHEEPQILASNMSILSSERPPDNFSYMDVEERSKHLSVITEYNGSRRF